MDINNTKQVSDWGNTLYDSTSSVGVFKADLVMVIGVIIASALVVIGIYMMMYNDDDNYLRIQGKVLEPNCVKASTIYDDKGKQVDNYKCNIVVTYMISGKVYSKNMYVAGISTYIKDEPIDLMVMKKDFTNVQFAHMDKTTMGCIMILSALGVIGITYLNYYLTHNYKIFAATQGVSTLAGFLH
jgi:hypothetical protein